MELTRTYWKEKQNVLTPPSPAETTQEATEAPVDLPEVGLTFSSTSPQKGGGGGEST